MSKTTFKERFQKTKKFFDNVYHHHKATYKGLGQFFNNYADVHKNYSNSLLWLSQTSSGTIPDFFTQQPQIQKSILEVCNHMQQIGQLHFNLSQRMRQIGDYCRQQYASSKRKKQLLMKLKIQKNQEAHENAKTSRDREKVNQKQQEICKALCQGFDEYVEDEAERTQKIKEQIVINFSLSKKIAERENQLANSYQIKAIKHNIRYDLSQLESIQNGIIDQYNGYGKDAIQRKNREFVKEMAIQRESLRQSIFNRQKAAKVVESLTKMGQIIEKYKDVPEERNYPNNEDYQIGIFDKRVIPKYKQFSGQFDSQALKELIFSWLSNFCLGTDQQKEAQSILTVAKANLKIRNLQISKAKSSQQFIKKFMDKCENAHKITLNFLMQISKVYEGTLRLVDFQKELKASGKVEGVNLQKPLHWKIGMVLIDAFLESVIISNKDEVTLYEGYVDIIKLVVPFAKATFGFAPTIILTLFLRKIHRISEVAGLDELQGLQQILNAQFDYNDEFSQTEQIKMHICHKLIHFLTSQMTSFYKRRISFSNLIKMSMIVQKILPKNYFVAMEHMHSCIKMAGFNFFTELDEDNKIIEGHWKGEERIRNLTEILEQLQLSKLNSGYFKPLANDLSELLGVGISVVLDKIKKQFLIPIWQITSCNIQILSQQEGVDRQGFILRLGVSLAQMDIEDPRPLPFYVLFFKVLESYLSSTEKDYDQLLDRARQTQIWIFEQNSKATQNCIDFCGLLCKPFQFLLTSLKKIEERKEQTQFTRKYSDFIKLKLNTALKGQIQKYLKFLEDSLNGFISSQPQLALKYKRLPQPLTFNNEDIAKDRFMFKEVTIRLYNLQFLRQQLDELVCDFIEEQVYKSMNYSIFNLEALERAAQSLPKYKAILLNIHSIASLILKTRQTLRGKIARITVYHFMKKIFANLYYQQQKGFFASDKDYKLSTFTFLNYEQQIEQIFWNINRNIKEDFKESFSKDFAIHFCKAYRCQLLDSNKFKIPIDSKKIKDYLLADLNLFCNIAKNRFIPQEIVRTYLEQPCLKLLNDLQKQASKLIDEFSQANVKNNYDEAKYILLILNLRKDDKSEEFVQRNKKYIR